VNTISTTLLSTQPDAQDVLVYTILVSHNGLTSGAAGYQVWFNFPFLTSFS
jgi:hypothetical protein